MSGQYEVEITRDGMWPTRWVWRVSRSHPYDFRRGETFTKDRARRKALKAKRSMENDDVRVVYP